MLTDPIADMLTRIRNASRAGHESVALPYSRLKKAVLNVMKEKGFIREVNIVKAGKFEEIRVGLLPEKRDIHLKKISKPGQRVYIGGADIKPVLDGYGVLIVSTSKGVIAGQEARKMNLGGEAICEIW